MRESSIEEALKNYAKERGMFTSKFVSPSNSGVPDRLFVCSGRVLFLELKAPGKKPTPLQMKRMKELEASGAEVGWVDSKQVGKDVLNSLYNKAVFWHPRTDDLKFEMEV